MKTHQVSCSFFGVWGYARAFSRKLARAYGKLDYAFNNAGILGHLALPTEYPEAEWDRMTDIHFKGIWLSMKYEIPEMLKQGKGAIVNMSSIAGLVALSSLGPAYVASKHGVIGLSRSTALAYRKKGIRVNVVCPGWIHTPLQAQVNAQWMAKMDQEGLVGEPIDIANAVLWLCSDSASFITGQTLVIDGGFLLEPYRG